MANRRRFVQSRKIETVKSLTNVSKKYVKAIIRKSCGEITRPAVILFDNNKPVKGNCKCEVVLCGICAHIIGLLLFLKHYTDTGEKILARTCTEQLQTWHRRVKKGSIPMIPLRNLGVRSARANKKHRE